MGAEANCTARIKGSDVPGKARLETEALYFRGGDVRLTIPFKSMTKIAARDGALRITGPDGPVSFALGPAAAKWADKIQHPPSRLQKLGVKPEWRVSILGVDDQAFLGELKPAVAQMSVGRTLEASDAIFVGATSEADLRRLESLRRSLTPGGALWVIRPKGRPEISERAVMAAGKAAGLVDVKVVAFSPTHTAEKFVIPLAKR
jgi:hypothetical protein